MIQSIPKKSTTLINFRAAKDLMKSFDLICRFRNSTRTSIIIVLIRDFINAEIPKIQIELNSRIKLDKTLEETNLDGCPDAPPEIFISTVNERDFSDNGWGGF